MTAACTHAGGRRPGAAKPRSTAAGTRGVLLINLGTPEEPATPAVRRYLTEFLSDPEVIRLPPRLRWLNRPLARMIARFRAPASAHAYRSIWTDAGSPLKVITEDQARALQDALPDGWRVFHAMRYGRPSIDSVVQAIAAEGIEDLVVIPMYPQHSGPTTGTALEKLYEALRRHGRRLSVSVRNTWYDDPAYVDAQARLVQRCVEEAAVPPWDAFLLFSTHSMPRSYVEAGDPYQEQVLRSTELVAARLGWPRERWGVAYQSKLGPVPWLEPSTEQRLEELADAGERNIVVCPISFTADCLETLEEIGIRYREHVEARGASLHLCPSLNTFPPFVKTLASLVHRGPRSADALRKSPEPLMRFEKPASHERRDNDALVMIGASIAGRLPGDRGPSLQHVTPEQFREAKRPHEEVVALLKRLRASGDFVECWLWNTCSRFEFYGWLKEAPRSSAADQAMARTVSAIFGPEADGLAVNVLQGEAVRHHLLRTAAGLNSGLPGDAEVTEQLDVAFRIARHCGTTGPMTEQLLESVRTGLADDTSWSRFRQDYSLVALKRIAVTHELRWDLAGCVVIGGSMTARSIITALTEELGVPPDRITAIHRARSRGVQLKRLREAVGEGRCLGVEQYDDREVLDAVKSADVVLYATDGRTPILDAAALLPERDFVVRPLVIVDFNTFGSTRGLRDVAGLHLVDAQRLESEVRNYAHGLCECPAFATAVDALEARLEEHASEPTPAVLAVAALPTGAVPTPVPNGSNGHGCGHRAGRVTTCPCRQNGVPARCPKRLLAERIDP